VPSFDVVSKADMQEVLNAVQQTRKEVAQRYDLKGANTEIEQEEKVLKITSADEFNIKAVVDVLQTKMVRRGVDLKFLEYGKIEPAGGGRARQTITVHQGLEGDSARDLVKRIKATGLKVQAQIQDDQVRVTGKKRDDLQAVMQALRGSDFPRPLQFVNMRE
jgi:uncharacterized protein YajQ (UPF0234 family)